MYRRRLQKLTTCVLSNCLVLYTGRGWGVGGHFLFTYIYRRAAELGRFFGAVKYMIGCYVCYHIDSLHTVTVTYP